MLKSGFLCGFSAVFHVPAIPAGIVFSKMPIGMIVLKKQHPVARAHLNMLNAVFRMNRFQSSGNPFVQNILQNLLQGVVRLAPVIERAADPGRRGIGGAQPCEPVSIFLSADAAVNAVDQKHASLSTLPNGNVCFHWVRQLTMHSMHGISENRLLHFQSSLFFQ